MTDSRQPSPQFSFTTDPVERLAEHLLRYPADLIDAHRLLRRFRVSSEGFQRALLLVEQRSAAQTSQTDSVS